MTPADARPVKCVVWDLDDTLWNGTLAEGGGLHLRPGVRDVLAALDHRGILHSIASKNHPDRAAARLQELEVAEYFLHPQVSWRPKSELVRTIAEALNIGLDTVLFIDDSPFELAEVQHAHPQVRCVDAGAAPTLPNCPDLAGATTAEARDRRRMYRQAEARTAYEADFQGPRAGFLASLGMRLTVAPATAEELERAAELTARTHQLNTTGLVFSAAELTELMHRDDQALLTVALEDCFGSYGTVGVVLLGLHPGEWRIRLLLMSCRVMGRNVGGAVLAYLAQQSDARGLRLTADFRENPVNRPMYLVYRLAGFVEAERQTDTTRLRLKPGIGRSVPGYVQLTVLGLPRQAADMAGPPL